MKHEYYLSTPIAPYVDMILGPFDSPIEAIASLRKTRAHRLRSEEAAMMIYAFKCEEPTAP